MPEPITFISLQEIGYAKPTIGYALHLVRSQNRTAALFFLARLNIDLSLAYSTTDPKLRNKTQERVISQIISERRRREVADKLTLAQVHQRPLVHRAQMLLAMKLVRTFARASGGNTRKVRDDDDVFGELALLINSLFDFENLAGLTGDELERELAAQMAPLFELMNPEPVGNGMLRLHAMLGEIYAPHTWQKVLTGFVPQPNLAAQLEQTIVFLTGFSFQAHQDLTFAVHSFYEGRRDEILEGPGNVAVMNVLHPDNIIGSSVLRRFLDLHAFDLDSPLSDSLDLGRRYFLDYTSFRKQPMWRLDPDHYLCVDPTFLVERLTSGMYWSIMNALDVDSRRVSFARLWGVLFETYVLQVLKDVYGSGTLSPLRCQPTYEDGVEAFDAILEGQSTLVTFQLKAMFVPIAAKASGDANIFFRGLNDKFGLEEGAALEQHVRNIELAFHRVPEQRKNIPGLDQERIQTVIPVVVTQEPVLRFGLVTKVLADAFVSRISTLSLRPDLIISRPVFLSIDELESLIGHLISGDITFTQALRVKIGTAYQLLSFWEAFRAEYLVPERFPSRKNPFLEKRWETLKAEALERFASGYYA